jgi:hypothetical protein
LARVTGHDLDPVARDPAQRLSRDIAVALVEFDDPPAHIAGPRVVAERAFDVAGLPRDHADQSYRTRRELVQRLPQPALDHGEPPGQRAVTVLVTVVPRVPVASTGDGRQAIGHR